MSTESPYHFAHTCKFKKRNLILYTFLMILYMYTATGQGQTAPWGQIFYVNRKPSSLCPFNAGLKKNCFEVWFYIHFFHASPYVYIAPSRGYQSIGNKTLMTIERPFLFAHKLQVSKWSVRNLILYIFLMILYNVYSSRARAENPLGTNFWCQQKPLITSTICCKFQTNLFEFWFF